MNHDDYKEMTKMLAKNKTGKLVNMGKLFPAGLEPATFRVLGGRDNHYTTETTLDQYLRAL